MIDQTSPSPRVLAAEWVLPVTAPPIRDGAVVIDEGRIAWVGERYDLPSRYLKAPVRGFPRSLLLPGWVNAHSHLNLTAALGMAPGTADRFTDWVRAVVQLQTRLPEHILRQSIVAGLDLLISTGTTTTAHVSTLPQLEPFLEHPMRSVVFHEPIGFRSDRAGSLLEEAEEWLDAAEALIEDADASHVRVGLAPHAPYSVSPALLRGAAKLAERRGAPLSVHVAETRAEAEFVFQGGGPFRELLEEREAWDPSWTPPGVTPVAYLSQLGVLGRKAEGAGPTGLAVHCNYVSEADLALLADARLTPTWCPGSHLFFGHREHPARRLLDAGIPLALGTDSLASNAGLNMLREARLAAAAFPEVDRSEWLRAGTLTGAQALGLGTQTGSLEPGKAADLQVLQWVSDEATDPLMALFEADLRVRMVLTQGVEAKIR
ncbi:MAG: amidohydrolase family protein [Actinomycetota bacterium]